MNSIKNTASPNHRHPIYVSLRVQSQIAKRKKKVFLFFITKSALIVNEQQTMFFVVETMVHALIT